MQMDLKCVTNDKTRPYHLKVLLSNITRQLRKSWIMPEAKKINTQLLKH